MAKLIYGIGYNSKGKYTARVNGRVSKAYYSWLNMLKRCYSKEYQAGKPTYIGCSVVSDWLDFQCFAKWFYNHDYSDSGYHLDKDILHTNNKVYSPDNCCFVPPQINSLLLDRVNDRGKYPQGVNWHKRDCVYAAMISINTKRKHLGYFDCPNEAHQAYRIAKEAYVKEKALEWQDRIADNVFQALMNWELV